ncbi:HNH endonuclease domain-containing protein [Streptomyces sp. NPDC049099]|uniref:HNH endonuclease n=1 Tax=Streptomyces sp. NPDC049099 TaxID=3155768 RepID=UPI00341AEB04
MSRRHRNGHMRGAKGRRKRLRMAAEQDGRCFYCRTRFADVLAEGTFDHFLPYALWRANARWNLVLACQACNEAKGDALPVGLLLLLWPLLDRTQLEVAA